MIIKWPSLTVKNRKVICHQRTKFYRIGYRCQFHQHFCAAFMLVDPKSAKQHCWLDCLIFAHLRSAHVKAARRTLMKLTPGLRIRWFVSENVKKEIIPLKTSLRCQETKQMNASFLRVLHIFHIITSLRCKSYALATVMENLKDSKRFQQSRN